MRRGFKKWCEEQSLYWRNELNLSVQQYLPSRDLATYFGIEVVGPEDIPGLAQNDIDRLLLRDPTGWSATLVSADGCSVIINNLQHSIARQESDIMHELAHIICEHDPVELKPLPGLPFPFREYRKEDEEEAEWLGACLQIPRDGLIQAIKQGLNEDQKLAEHFVASVAMVRFRRNKTGVDAQLRRTPRHFRK